MGKIYGKDGRISKEILVFSQKQSWIMRILIIDRFPKSFLLQLEQLPVEFTYAPRIRRSEVLSIIDQYEVIVMNSKIRMDKEAADKARCLQLVVRAGVGLDHIDVEYLEQKGIRVRNTAGANADAVSEQTVGMLLALRHNLIRANQQVKQFVWSREENRGLEVKGKTVGIIGYGNTGSGVARRLQGFGCRILAYDKYKEGFSNAYVEEVPLIRLFEEADILSLHVPLTDETRYWVNMEFFNQFHKPIVLLNLARGPIVRLKDLVEALDNGKVVAAALDVLENEKLHILTKEERTIYENLFHRHNVMLSPHIGGWTVESLANINGRIIEYIEELIR